MRFFHPLTKAGKSPGADLFPPDILPHAGPVFVEAITNALNHIKANLCIPDSWINVIITTFHVWRETRTTHSNFFLLWQMHFLIFNTYKNKKIFSKTFLQCTKILILVSNKIHFALYQ